MPLETYGEATELSPLSSLTVLKAWTQVFRCIRCLELCHSVCIIHAKVTAPRTSLLSEILEQPGLM